MTPAEQIAQRIAALRTELGYLEETGRTARAAQVRSVLAELEPEEHADATAADVDAPPAEDSDDDPAAADDDQAAEDGDAPADKPVKRRR